MLHSSRATIRDKLFIIACILSGSKKGRIMLDAYVPISMKNIKSEIHSILSSHHTLRDDPAYAVIYKRNGIRIGFAIIKSSHKTHTEYLLYAMAVASGYRGKGYGSMIIDDVYGWHLPNHYHSLGAGSSVTTRKPFSRHVGDDGPAGTTDSVITSDYRKAA